VIGKVHHISYVVADLDAVTRYLSEQLGLEPTWVGGETRERREAVYQLGETELQVKQPGPQDRELQAFLEKNGPGVHHVAWATTGLDELAPALFAAGATLRDGPAPHRSAESSDPRLAVTYKVVNIMAATGHGLGERIQLVEEDAPGG
jgi:methylmalonyl-CoA/ethylmalonyl-CoA epimerase